MSNWSWKQAVAESVLEIVNERSRTDFFLDDVYARRDTFAHMFPSNRHIKEKIRQTLQQLRDDGFLVFHGQGKYQVNLGFEDLEDELNPVQQKGSDLPRTKKVTRSLRLRCTLLASEIKRRYRNVCQLCRVPVVLSSHLYYAEGHHLQPIGAPHLGPDVVGNIIVLCPNHHIMFDRGAILIVPETLVVSHVVDGVFTPDARLYVQSWHKINPAYITYHNSKIFTQF